MSFTQAVAWLGIVAVMVLFVFVIVWIWRDMGERNRPRWLRLIVILTGNIFVLGFAIYLVDLARHPHDSNLTRRDVLLQRYRNRPDHARA